MRLEGLGDSEGNNFLGKSLLSDAEVLLKRDAVLFTFPVRCISLSSSSTSTDFLPQPGFVGFWKFGLGGISSNF